MVSPCLSHKQTYQQNFKLSLVRCIPQITMPGSPRGLQDPCLVRLPCRSALKAEARLAARSPSSFLNSMAKALIHTLVKSRHAAERTVAPGRVLHLRKRTRILALSKVSLAAMAMKLPTIPSKTWPLEGSQSIQKLLPFSFHKKKRWPSPKISMTPSAQVGGLTLPDQGAHGGEMPRHQMIGAMMAATAQTSARGAPRVIFQKEADSLWSIWRFS
mmetsp:Transcript_35743/g.70847  ORF Transcript_35743/g.70847 Transcript_35743/m.70847 type:complete len:215 (+) Transcript_35743:759-1403(+)